jgi:tricarballylate dehydrogenase
VSENYDVIVVGGGNAAMCAALAAREGGARVLVLERSPEYERGGNTRHTRNIRCSHAAGDEFFSGAYAEEEHLQDLVGVTGGPANLDLAKLAVRESSKLPSWMSAQGVHWQQPLAGTLHLGRTNRWFLGGGKALLNTYYRTAARMGIAVRYNARVEDLVIENGRFEAVRLNNSNSNGSNGELVHGRAVVVAAGGYEANIEWLKRHWGEAAENFIIRGSAYNDGTLLAALLKAGAKSIGDPKGFHAIAVDARAPKFDGGIVTRLDVVPFGIVVNRFGQRFYDEGEDIWPKRYAIWGTLIASQPGQIAYGVVDSQTIDRFLPPLFKPYRADSLGALAAAMGLEPGSFVKTLTEYNNAVSGNAEAQMQHLDGLSTRGITPKKSNWALPIDRPPFYGLPLRPGITFTYMGVAVDERARVLDSSGRAFQNVYAAGEIMSGNILTKGYLGGFGLTIGSVFGRLAGKEAAANGRG